MLGLILPRVRKWGNSPRPIYLLFLGPFEFKIQKPGPIEGGLSLSLAGSTCLSLYRKARIALLCSPLAERERETRYRGGDMATTASGTVSGAAYEDQRGKRVLENLKHLEVTINQALLFLLETVSWAPIPEVHPSMDPLPFPPYPSFRSSPPIRAGSSIDLSVLLTLVPFSFVQDLGISEMSKSLLQAARLQNKSKVLLQSPLPCACAVRTRLLMRTNVSSGDSTCFDGSCRAASARARRRGRSSTPPRCGDPRGQRPRFPTRMM
jgi:hypothetical protein